MSVKKVQKTFYLDRGLEAQIAERVRYTGSSFTRIITASVVAYFDILNEQQRGQAMKTAMVIEKKHHAKEG